MAITDIMVAVILGALAVVFMIFIIAEILRDYYRTKRSWEKLDEDEEDEKWG